MHIEFLVEELSAEEALRKILPGILGEENTFDIHSFQGKKDIRDKLAVRLKGYRNWIPPEWRVVVLIDADDDDCRQLKAEMNDAASRAGMISRSAVVGDSTYQVLNRIAVEELEAWFFGDVAAIRAAYPKIDPKLGIKAKYRVPDAIAGGTWEALERVLQKAGYHSAGLPKVTAARAISAHMEPERNRSQSFQAFYHGLLDLVRQQMG